MTQLGSKRMSLPYPMWTEIDRRLWEAATDNGKRFLRPGKATHWAPESRKEVRKAYGYWLQYLRDIGGQDDLRAPSERIAEEALEEYVQEMKERGLAPVTVRNRVRDLREAVRVMEPHADLSLLSSALGRLRARASPCRNKHARIVHPREAWDGVRSHLEALREIECANELIRASWYRDALEVAFIIWRPIRLKNLASLRIGGNMTRGECGWRCRFDARKTKDRRALEFTLPKDLEPYLDRYLDIYRPRLLNGAASDHLWISIRSGPLSAQALYIGIINATEAVFGHPINPHLFRDCAATALATDEPEHVLAIARILGHGTITTAERHYNQSQMMEASERLNEVLIELKSEAKADDDEE